MRSSRIERSAVNATYSVPHTYETENEGKHGLYVPNILGTDMKLSPSFCYSALAFLLAASGFLEVRIPDRVPPAVQHESALSPYAFAIFDGIVFI